MVTKEKTHSFENQRKFHIIFVQFIAQMNNILKTILRNHQHGMNV